MTRAAVRRLLSLLLSITFAAGIGTPSLAVDGDRYVSLANQKRASVNLGPAGLHWAADQVAIERAEHMARHDDFSHDMDYVVTRLRELGVCFTGYGEIIAWERGFATYDPARTMEGWWASSSHRAIIVGDYNAAGGSHATSSATNKLYAVMVWVKLCGGSSTAIQRIAGSDRYATAAAISRARFAGGASTVFIATGASFPDALAGAPAAANEKAPILLTAPDALPAATATELSRLGPGRIVVLGGSGAVGESVVAQLRSYTSNVVRWSGANRFETAATISRQSFASGSPPVAYVATARSFPDALAGGAVAGLAGGPILLVERDAVPAATAAELARLHPGTIVVLGGDGVVSESVRSDLARYAGDGKARRLAGSDRYATSVQISKSAYGGSGSGAVFVATGANFPDGLAGGPVAALVPGPLLLVTPTSLPSSVASELQRLGPDAVYVLGSTGAVSDGVVRAIDAVLP